MRYWWVNQNKTHRQEIGGGYLWSPKRNKVDHRVASYEFMREVSPGDLVFSFVDTRFAAVGIATSNCYECPKPAEFGKTGDYWNMIGWKVRVNFVRSENQVRPIQYMGLIEPLLPQKYSPLQPSGHGNQMYLAEISPQLAQTITGLIGRQAQDFVAATQTPSDLIRPAAETADIETWEHHLEQTIESNTAIPDTERESLIVARRGQGLFKDRVLRLEQFCRVTKVDKLEHLRASHCKPWRDSTNEERLNGENGLLLTPSIDHLFDRGFISFEDKGRLIISPVAHKGVAQPNGSRN
jgi:putative restriction endonuclease